MKKISIIALAAIATISSCTKDGLFPDKDGREEIVTGTAPQVFNAIMEGFPATRATLDGMTPSWEVGDVVSIDGHSYTAKTAGTGSTFEGTGAGEAIHHAYFPAGLYNGGSPALPAVQTYVAGKFDMPMYAESSTTDLPFKNLCGVLAITVNGTDFTSVSSIEVSSDKQMNGEFTATDDGTLTFKTEGVTLTNALKKVTLTFASAKTIASEGSATFYIPVPAGTHNPLAIKVTSGSTSKLMVTKKSGGVAVVRNTVYPIAFDGQPITGTADVLSTAGISGNKVKWVQLWAGGPKFAEYNVGASSATDVGSTMTFTDATKAGAEYVWGANWCTPSKDQMDELLKAATSDGSTKVDCNYIQENGVYGFKFTGKETGYTSNSVFFPARGGYSDYGYADYWSAAANGSEAWYMRLRYNYDWDSRWLSYYQDFNLLVRPVFKN